ncbi:electron transfer flavoprotein subunit alpha/FixB family protein [Thaumasiovibrio subtropicus]|uniref:electron transfer flavoprotein subunit alpha/FixB family protein n=1 Tax=Thaumasiovibrio subtropicus TaxID=1891207 RepID=UPI000B34C507|nr:FAD-binding protein [Thaumasiovibrio subtropicus]
MSEPHATGVLVYLCHDTPLSSAKKLIDIVRSEIAGQPEIDVLVAGEDSKKTRIEGLQHQGVVNKVLLLPSEDTQLAVASADALSQQAPNYRYLVAASGQHNQVTLSRVAAQHDVGMLSDVVAIRGEQFVRPMYAGNALACMTTSDPLIVMTLRVSAFDVEPQIGDKAASSEEMPLSLTSNGVASTKWLAHHLLESARPELGSAEIVVSGGRGFQQAEHFELLEALADKLGAAIGASRAAVDAGFISNDHQVGQTGKVIAPKLYIAIGISGAIQHVAGIKDAGVVIAINRDPDAAIFDVADVGYVGDLFDVLPQLIDGL